MSTTTESIQIENVVASSDIGQELNLEALSLDLTGSDYDPDNFPGLVYRTQKPKAASLIFRSGKVVCTGANSVDNVKTALTHVSTNSVSWASMSQPRQQLRFRILSQVGISITRLI